MIAGVADTHTVIWYLFDDARLSAAAGTFIDQAAANGERIGVSPITLGRDRVSSRQKENTSHNVHRGARRANGSRPRVAGSAL